MDQNCFVHYLLACNFQSAKIVEIVAKAIHVSYKSTIFNHAHYLN